MQGSTRRMRKVGASLNGPEADAAILRKYDAFMSTPESNESASLSSWHSDVCPAA